MDASLYQSLQQGATLLTATQHLAHALQNDYAEQAQQHGLKVWPTPRILPWRTYLRLACQQQRELSSTAPRLLSEPQALALWDHLVSHYNDALPLDEQLLNPAQAAKAARQSWQLMYQFGIKLSQVSAYPTREAQTFATWAHSFIERTAAKGWLDSARFASWLLDSAFQPDTDLLIYGFDALTPDMQHLIKHWREHGKQIEIKPPTNNSQHSQVQVLAAQDAGAELKQAAQWARALLAQQHTQKIAIVVPDLSSQAASVTRRFADVFAPAQRAIDAPEQPLAFQVVATPPLSDYALAHHALWLLQLCAGNADVLRVGQLLRSPFIAGYDSEASARALADLAARESRVENWQLATVERLALKAHCPQLASCLRAAHDYLHDQTNTALPSVWTERLTQVLQHIGWAKGRALDSREQQTHHKFRELLGELSALDELLGKISLTHAIATITDACHAERFAPESVDQCVTVIDANSIAGMQFDAVWVMGLHAGSWPPAPQPDAYLPIELQRSVGMTQASAELSLRQSRQVLQRLVAAAPTVVLSWPHHDGDEELRHSPLLEAWIPSSISHSTHTIASLAEHLFAQKPNLESLADTQLPPQAPGEVKGGTRVLELQSRCPFRAQAELRLFAKPVPVVSPAVEPAERGNLVHRVLREVWQQLKDSNGLHAIDLHQYADQVRQIAQRIAPLVLKGDTTARQVLIELEVELCTQWVMALLQLDQQRPPFAIHRAEQLEAYDLAGMQIRIQLDRIDTLADGSQLLIDYKTGISNNVNDWLDRTPGRPRSPQLPLYALAHREQLSGISFAVLSPGTAEYRGLAKQAHIAPGIRDFTQEKRLQPEGVTDWDQLLAHWQQLLTQLAQQYLAGHATVNPLSNECSYCHLRGLCRITEVQESTDASDNDNLEQDGAWS